MLFFRPLTSKAKAGAEALGVEKFILLKDTRH